MSGETQNERVNSEWWKKVEEIYHTARELNGDERAQFLDTACKADTAMRRQIDVLLQQNENPDTFLNKPAMSTLLGRRHELAAGIQLGSYRIEAPIGEGGMGV